MFVIRHSANVKVGNVSVTYAPIKATCPASCPLRDSGCYAQGGNVAIHEKRLSAHTDGIGGDTIAELEGNEIADVGPTMPAGQPLRIHVAGDATTPTRAAHLARGAAHWPGPVWSYTHAWRDVPRASWNTISVLASVETRAAALEALASGYAPGDRGRPTRKPARNAWRRWLESHPLPRTDERRRQVHRLQAVLE